jgi:hypothetical protein
VFLGGWADRWALSLVRRTAPVAPALSCKAAFSAHGAPVGIAQETDHG